MREEPRTRGPVEELAALLAREKRWWMTPLLVLLIFGMMSVLYLLRHQSTEFIYSLF